MSEAFCSTNEHKILTKSLFEKLTSPVWDEMSKIPRWYSGITSGLYRWSSLFANDKRKCQSNRLAEILYLVRLAGKLGACAVTSLLFSVQRSYGENATSGIIANSAVIAGLQQGACQAGEWIPTHSLPIILASCHSLRIVRGNSPMVHWL